ncbi:MAG: class I adenylate-forming enzyme family protein, partial [Caulobacterales bacterium]
IVCYAECPSASIERFRMIASPEARRTALERSHPQWRAMTISAALEAAAARHPGRPYVLTKDAFYSYADMRAWARTLASGLIASGVKSGDKVALDMANYPEFVAVKFAIAMAGATAVPINFLLRGQEIAYVLRQSDSAALVTMDRFRGHNYLADLDEFAPGWRDGAADALPRLKHVGAFPPGPNASPRTPTLDDLAQRATAASDAELERRLAQADPHALSDIIYTSGTTGRSKGVMLTHDMVMRAAFASVYTRAFEDGRRILFALPMYHVFGYVECMIAVTFVGGAIIPQAIFEPVEMLDLAEKHAASEMVCVPMMTHKLIETAAARGFDSKNFLAMFNSGGANVPSIWGQIREVLGAREVLTAYGMTETTASTTCTLPEGGDEHLLNSNGRFKPAHCAGDPELSGLTAVYKTIDPETEHDLPVGESGELVVKGPIVTRGYYNKPEETAAAFTRDGWLRTGDIGRVNADGYLSLTGRLKETYRCGGEMVMPREIEALFDDWPGVAQVLAVGIPDPKMGEIGVLAVVPIDPANPPSLDSMLSVCAEKLARFKVPKHALFLQASEIPLTVTGRPQKFKLAPIVTQKLSA